MRGQRLSCKERLKRLEDSQAERVKLMRALCDHLERGLSLDCFGFIGKSSLKRLLDTFTEDFSKEELEVASQKGRETWELIGYKQATGQCLGNSRSWYYNMANRYGWRERIDIEAEHKGNVIVEVVNYARPKLSTHTPE